MSPNTTETALRELETIWRKSKAGAATQAEAKDAIRAALDAGARWPEIGRAMGYGPRTN